MIVILGLMVVLGACLVIYYQLGPKTTTRLKGSLREDRPEGHGSQNGWDAEGEFAHFREREDNTGGDDKVLYIFGRGEHEERSLRREESDDEKQGGDN